MTENKRFIVKGFDEYDKRVWDTEFEQTWDVEDVVTMLNNKDWIIDTLKEENKELKHFKEKCIDLIDKKIAQYKKGIKKIKEQEDDERIISFQSDYVVLYISMLEELQREFRK